MKIYLKLLGFSPSNQTINSTENVEIFSPQKSFPFEEFFNSVSSLNFRINSICHRLFLINEHVSLSYRGFQVLNQHFYYFNQKRGKIFVHPQDDIFLIGVLSNLIFQSII